MIKLVTQFDNEKTKMSLATPTCGACCCCCCCCIISTFASASVTARSFASYVNNKLPKEPDKVKIARNIGFLYPLGLVGLFLLTLFNFNESIIWISVLIGLIYLGFIAYLLYRKTKISGIIGMVVSFTFLLVAIEFLGLLLGMYMLALLNIGYLFFAVLLSFLLVVWAFSGDNKVAVKNNQEEEKEQKEKEIEERIIKEMEEYEGEHKVCLNCGTANPIDSKKCYNCSSSFEMDDNK